MSARNIVLIITQTGIYNLYLYELFWGNLNEIINRGMYYAVTALTLLFLTFEDILGHKCQFNIICKFSLIVNFILFAVTLFGLLKSPVLCLLLLNGSVFAISIMVLSIFKKHGYFTKDDTNT